MTSISRCEWVGDDEEERHYHDNEWGVPSRDDRYLFEMLILEGAQAGLSWRTILHKRHHYREAMAGFDAEKLARFTRRDEQRLLRNPGIVRNRLKVSAAITNSRYFLELVDREGSFADFLWRFVDGRPINNRWCSLSQIPTQTPAAQAMSRSLKQHGFRFVGPTICYAFMEAVGMVNDHTTDCHRYHPVAALHESF